VCSMSTDEHWEYAPVVAAASGCEGAGG